MQEVAEQTVLDLHANPQCKYRFSSKTLEHVHKILHLHSDTWLQAWEVVELVRSVWGVRMSESACTARIRDLRKAEYGDHNIPCEFIDGHWKYRLKR